MMWLLATPAKAPGKSSEPLVNRHFHDLDEFEDVQAQRCVVIVAILLLGELYAMGDC
jgi:hypothetical protein